MSLHISHAETRYGIKLRALAACPDRQDNRVREEGICYRHLSTMVIVIMLLYAQTSPKQQNLAFG